MKIGAAIAVLVVCIVAAMLYRRSVRQDELEAQRVQAEREARQHVDLSALPEAAPVEEKKPEPKFKKKPIVVEVSIKQKRGAGLKPFKGKYQLLNAAGDIVGQDEALGNGEPAVFIVTPGYYRFQVPSKKFSQDLTLNGEDKVKVDVVVATK